MIDSPQSRLRDPGKSGAGLPQPYVIGGVNPQPEIWRFFA
jgi:hypothetical protein